jgi:hypothetical protein
MQPTLPVNQVVNVAVQLTPSGAQAQSLSNLLVMGTSTVIDPVERYRIYGDLPSVAADFGTVAEEYLAATKWFGQAPQPTSLIIGRWIDAAARGGLRCATLSASQQSIATWNAITTGSFAITKDGGAATDITGLNFSAAANLNAVAAIIQAAMAGITCVWNSNYQRFEFESTTTGATSTIAFLAAAGSGTNIAGQLGGTSSSSGAYLYAGQAAETAVAATAVMDGEIGQQWYGYNMPSAINADHLAIAAYIQAATVKHIYGLTSQEAAALVANATTDIGYQMEQLGYNRTLCQWSSSDAYAVVSLMARAMTVNYNGNLTVITLKFKQEPGVVAEYINTSQAASLKAKNYNVFVNYANDTAIVQEGVMANGTFIDVITGTDWLAVTLQNELYNQLYTSVTKIPQTDAGMQLLTTACDRVCAQGVANGLLAPGQWNAAGFGQLSQGDFMAKGYYIYNAPVATQLQSDRDQRLAMPIQIAAKLAGAIHKVDVLVTVNQ